MKQLGLQLQIDKINVQETRYTRWGFLMNCLDITHVPELLDSTLTCQSYLMSNLQQSIYYSLPLHSLKLAHRICTLNQILILPYLKSMFSIFLWAQIIFLEFLIHFILTIMLSSTEDSLMTFYAHKLLECSKFN